MAAPDPHRMPADGRSSPDELRELVAALFREHYEGLCGFTVRYVKSRDIAEEVVQEVFLRVWEQCEVAGTATPTRAYLYAAARNRAITILRHERVVEHHVMLYTSRAIPRAEEPPTDAAFELDELTKAARRAIAALPEQSRLVFLLSRERGLSYAEIAAVLGLAVKTVESHMVRALKRLRASLDVLGAIGLVVHTALRLLG